MKKATIIAAFMPEAVLKRKVRAHLRKLGFKKSGNGALSPPTSSKESVRAVHSDQRKAGLKAQGVFVKRVFPELKHHFAEGHEVDPVNILPASGTDRRGHLAIRSFPSSEPFVVCSGI